jgi:hypothetical protein
METITRSEPAINLVVTDWLVYRAEALFVPGTRIGFAAPIVPAPQKKRVGVRAFRRGGVAEVRRNLTRAGSHAHTPKRPYAFSFPQKRKSCMINHNVDIRR